MIRWSGTQKLRGRLKAQPELARQALAKGLFEEAERIMTASKMIVPVDKGILRSSGQVQAPKQTRFAATVTMEYGGAARDYALVQHERTDYHHTVGEAKFLEKPLKEAARGFGKRVGKYVK